MCRLDQRLKEALLKKMVPLSNTKIETLFEGYGPLNSFSSKIDVAHAFGLLSEENRTCLVTIKKIRNMFAHPTVFVDFTSQRIIELCSLLPDYQTPENAKEIFFKTLAQIEAELVQSNAPNEPTALPERSP